MNIIPPDLFIDTCILFGDYTLNNTNFFKIIKYKASTNCKIYISEIVIDELVEQYKKHILHEEKGIETLSKTALKKINMINQYLYEGSKLEIPGLKNIDISNLITGYRQYLESKLRRSSFIIYPIAYSETSYKTIINKSIQRKKPFSIIEKDKDKGIKDAVIWESYKELLKTNNNIIFLSDNKNDFGNDDCTDFHGELRDEIGGSDGFYFNSLSDILSRYTKGLEEFLKEKTIESLININDIENIIRENMIYLDYEIDHSLPEKIEVLDFNATGYIENIILYEPWIKYIGELYTKLSIAIEFDFEFETHIQGDRDFAEKFLSYGIITGTCSIDLELNNTNGLIKIIEESCEIDTLILEDKEICEYVKDDLEEDKEKSISKQLQYYYEPESDQDPDEYL